MIPAIELNANRSERVCYDNPDYPVYIRRALLSHYPDFQAPDHWHDDIELIYVFSGQMKYNINGEIVSLKPGGGIFVNSGQMHYGFSDTREECDFLCVIFHPLFLCPSYPYEKNFMEPVIQNTQMPFLLLGTDLSWHQDICAHLVQVWKDRDLPAAPLRALSSFAWILSLLYEHMQSDTRKDTRSSCNLQIIKKMVQFIQKNYTEKITLSQIASAGGVGQSKCCKLFTKYFSQTPNEYLNHYRLSKSVVLLRSTDMSVTEIALSVGFGSASYYAETFRKWLNKSPTDLRRETRTHSRHPDQKVSCRNNEKKGSIT